MPSEVKKGWTEGCVVKMSCLAKVTGDHLHPPSSPTTGNKTKESSASEVRLGALLPMLFCKYLLLKALHSSNVIAWYTSLRAFFSQIPDRSQPGDSAGVGGGVAHASPWQQPCHSQETALSNPPPPHACVCTGEILFKWCWEGLLLHNFTFLPPGLGNTM